MLNLNKLNNLDNAQPATPSVKSLLHARSGTAELHVLHNLARGLDPFRGFTRAKGQGVNIWCGFVQACRRLLDSTPPRLAGLDLLPRSWRVRLEDALRRAHLDAAAAALQQGDLHGHVGALRDAMQRTPHGLDSTAFGHGRDCWLRYRAWRLALQQHSLPECCPAWLVQHSAALLADQLDLATMRGYLVYHDVGKTTTICRDEEGRVHFPDHAAASEAMWRATGQAEDQAVLMGLDMALHTLAPDEALRLVPRRLGPSLLLATLAQLESNSNSVFGGPASDATKMKFKAFNRRAKRLCEAWYGAVVRSQPADCTGGAH